MKYFDFRVLGAFAILSVLSGCGSVPTSEPAPAPIPVPAPIPAPAPIPVPAPIPAPAPIPVPAPIPAPAPIPVPAPIVERPTIHAWSYLRGYGYEPEYYATYSYILVGRTGSESEAVNKFHRLIQAIQGSTSSTKEILDGTARRDMNLFLIPAVKGGDVPDIVLAKSYVSALEASHESFRNPGPFIVTLYEPISADVNDVKQVLLVDLTGIHEGAFKEIVSVFKGRVMDAPITGIEILRSFKASLLSLAFLAEDSIRFAPTAHAQMRAVFEPE